MNAVPPDLRAFFFKTQKWQYNRCLAPGMSCEQKAIRAHSIQNSIVLDMLSRDGHVKAMAKRIDKDHGPQVAFEDVGRNQATTFTGFCSAHDTSIFRSIDTAPLDPANQEHLFLLAYRALAREMQANLDGASKIQSAYMKRVEHGLDDPNDMSPAGVLATQHLIKAYELYRYKVPYDFALHRRRFDTLRHSVLTFPVARPTVAVSALFSLDNALHDGTWINVALSVLPVGQTEVVAVFTYTTEHKDNVAVALQRLFQAQGEYQKYELSKIILNYCENFVVAPDHFDTWPPEKVQAITQYFLATLFQGNLAHEDERLFLF